MRVLPCKSKCKGQPALASKDGTLQTLGQMANSSIVYMCKRCGLPSLLQSYEFHGLPLAETDAR